MSAAVETTTDSLGPRMKFAVLVPSTNTVVEPEYALMRPPGVTNHTSRIAIPNNPITSDADFSALMLAIKAAMMRAVDDALTCEPGHLILGMSAETFWDGIEGSEDLRQRLLDRGAPGVTLASDACQAALRTYGAIARIGVITPYMPVGDAQVRRFFTECGFDVAGLIGLACPSPTKIAHVTRIRLRQAIHELDAIGVDAIVQVGTNLAMASLAAEMETTLGKPVLAINTATYWHALRTNGIPDQIPGFGKLLEQY
jgi:maleate isomerase